MKYLLYRSFGNLDMDVKSTSWLPWSMVRTSMM